MPRASLLGLGLLLAGPWSPGGQAAPARFTPLVALPAPRLVTNAVPFPGGHYEARNLLDGNPRTEYSSEAKGTNTFVELDYGRTIQIAAFRHRDRNDPATVAASELIFSDAAGRLVTTVPVTHVNQRAGITFFVLPSPVEAQRIRWRVTGLGPKNYGTVGGAEIGFYRAGETEAAPRGTTLEITAPALQEKKGATLTQPLRISVHYPYAEPVEAILRIEGLDPILLPLATGTLTREVSVPSVLAGKPLKISLEAAGQVVASQAFPLKPVRPLEIYLLPHSHVDIGYTALQAEVERKQNENLEIGLRLAEATKDYPEGARFKWNVEVLWPVENYLRQATPEKRAALLQAIKSGAVGLDAFYGNILTGLCRPEELVRLMSYATRLSDLCGVPIESAMISDVPGYTWSTVSAMAHAGVRYFSFAPNYFDRMGGTMVTWQNQPFYWKGPDGRQRVLCWCPSRGYALGHLIGDGEALARFLPDYVVELETNKYPYDISHLRWNVHGDNGSPDEKVADVVRDWNARYAYPKLIMATTATAFREFEKRYGKLLPEYSGDYTPYWEDGAGSSALETGLNRAAAERLVQAETLWVMRQPGPFPAESFQAAWRNVLLYSEHTWGAHNSISQPDVPFVKDQWKVKQAFALDADKASRQLLAAALGEAGAGAPNPAAAGPREFDVFNPNSWPRSDLILLSREQAVGTDRVVDEQNQVVASQRLASGELAFVARQVPAFGARRFRLEPGLAMNRGTLQVRGTTLMHPDYVVRVDEQTGAIASLHSRQVGVDLVDRQAATAINDYFYLPGSEVKNVKRNDPPRITVKESGPVLASLVIESAAPGCKWLQREVRVVDGLDYVEIINTLDKLPIRTKEAIHFGFGFNVPKGVARLDVGWAVVRPELDQIPASCKNWFSVQRWVDISNNKYGVTWATVDAPLVELGGLTANLIGSQTDPRVWLDRLEPTQTLYSWAMNNHWHTNYRADQEGPTVFRFALRAHKAFSPLEAAQFGVARSQPLLVTRAAGPPLGKPRLQVSPDDVLVTAFKPSDDGRGLIVRLFGASGKEKRASLLWPPPGPQQLWLSDTSEKPREKLTGAATVPAWGIVTVRAE